MKASRLEWKVGLFVTIGLVLLAALLIQFSKGQTFFRSTYIVNLRAESGGSLKPRAQVLMAGVQVGSVTEIRLTPSGTNVIIPLRIYSDYIIYKSARFSIEQSGFLGDQYIAIAPTTNAGPVFANGETAQAEAPFNLQEVARSASGLLQRINQTAQKVNESIVDLQRLLLNEQTLTNLALAAANLREVSDHALTAVDSLNTVIATNGPALTRSGSNLLAFSEQLRQAGHTLDGVLVTNGPVIDAAVKNIESSTVVLKNLVDDVQAGKGLAGTLLRNEEVAADMTQIVRNLSITTSNLNRVGLWGILWKPKQPRAVAPTGSGPLSSPKGTP